jgi:hypothetical protein
MSTQMVERPLPLVLARARHVPPDGLPVAESPVAAGCCLDLPQRPPAALE